MTERDRFIVFSKALANYERAFSKILDVFDITVETYNSDTNISKYLAKVKEIKELEENGFKPNNPILIKKKKERGILISNAGYSLNKNNILLTSSFTYIYSIFESYNNILLDIFEDIDGNDSLLKDKLHKLCKINPNGYIENSVYQEVFIKGDKKAASKLKLFPNLFYELNGLFQADKYFKDEGQLEKYKMLIDFHSEIKIRRNILTHDSLEFLKNDNKLVSNYLSRFNDKKSVSDKKRIKSLLKFLFGNKHANLNEKDLEIDIAYINHVVCVLLELMTIFFASVFSGFQVELKNKPKRDKINCIDESRLFSEVINRLNCSFDSFLVKGKGVSSLGFSRLHSIINVTLLSKIFDKSKFNNDSIPLLDYINRLLYVDYSIIEIKKSMTYFKNELRDVLSKEKPNKKNSDLLENIVSKLKVIYDELSTEYDIRFEKIEKSNLIDEVTLSMLKSYLEKNELLFLKYYDELMKKQHPNKNEGDLKTLSSNNSRSWFMIKYLIKKTKNKDFKEYFTK